MEDHKAAVMSVFEVDGSFPTHLTDEQHIDVRRKEHDENEARQANESNL